MKTILALLLAALLSACGKKPTNISFLNKVLTVAEFTEQTEIRKKVLAECGANPGQLQTDPNCINADKADWISIFSK